MRYLIVGLSIFSMSFMSFANFSPNCSLQTLNTLNTLNMLNATNLLRSASHLKSASDPELLFSSFEKDVADLKTIEEQKAFIDRNNFSSLLAPLKSLENIDQSRIATYAKNLQDISAHLGDAYARDFQMALALTINEIASMNKLNTEKTVVMSASEGGPRPAVTTVNSVNSSSEGPTSNTVMICGTLGVFAVLGLTALAGSEMLEITNLVHGANDISKIGGSLLIAAVLCAVAGLGESYIKFVKENK